MLRKFLRHMGTSSAIIQMAVDDAMIATRLLLKYCWASMTTAISTKRRIMPLTADFRTRGPRKISSPLARPASSRRSPAVQKRIPPSRNGGNPCSAVPIK